MSMHVSNMIKLHNLWWPTVYTCHHSFSSKPTLNAMRTHTHAHCHHRHVEAGRLFATQSFLGRVSHRAMTGIVLSISLLCLWSNQTLHMKQLPKSLCVFNRQSIPGLCWNHTHTHTEDGNYVICINTWYHLFVPTDAEWFCGYQITN